MDANTEILSLTEMRERFHGQWLAVRVTERDEAGQPVAGELIAHKPSRLEVSLAVKDARDICLVYAGAPVPEGYGVLY
jgi:hypothetical protein